METQVRTPQLVFMQPQRLVVPLFQRPYVWNEENQWEPLWQDITRVAQRLLLAPTDQHFPHFLGAVVLQQVPNPLGSLQERVIIDGQQRLTTLQLLLDALHAELVVVEATQAASRIETLVCNQEAFWSHPEDRFKVWPTNRDRAAFNEVMSADPPVAHGSLQCSSSRMAHAHRYFSEQARGWLVENGAESVSDRAVALDRTVRELLQLVVIDLSPDENAQEIFETLNARGAQLTAADLIKNFVFQRLIEAEEPVEQIYEEQWKEFETGFWETEISAGRLRYPRSALFLNQWLIAKTGEEIVAREVFSRFKVYADFDAEMPMATLIGQVHRSSNQYRALVEAGARASGQVDRIELFMYRTSTLESEVVKPLVLALLDPDEALVPGDQVTKALASVESWMVRRMLVRATTKAYNQVFAELVTQVHKGDRAEAGNVVEDYLKGQTGDARYWPDDEEVRREVEVLVAYRRLRRGRLRMVLEAIEDHLRGWDGEKAPLAAERAMRGKYAIEHVMPRSWVAHWPIEAGESGEVERERDQIIHTIGNLTLLTGGLNGKVSNGPWAGATGKKEAVGKHDVLLLNRDLLKAAGDAWTVEKIRRRTAALTDLIVEIWPVPEGHTSPYAKQLKRESKSIDLADLINAGMLEPGQALYPRRRNPRGVVAIILADGQIEVDEIPYAAPSGAAAAVCGQHVNGWWYFLVTEEPKQSLRQLRREYAEQRTVDVDDEDDAEVPGDDEES